MALGRAVVATRLGAEGLPFRDGAELMLADEPRAFADAVAALVAQPARRAELERRARAAVEREFSAARAAQRFEELLVAAVGAA
jgi:glycosyltransferase involved in cell wall biosynthesis